MPVTAGFVLNINSAAAKSRRVASVVPVVAALWLPVATKAYLLANEFSFCNAFVKAKFVVDCAVSSANTLPAIWIIGRTGEEAANTVDRIAAPWVSHF